MENSKTPRKYTPKWYDAQLFDLQDTRYYGVFIKGKDEDLANPFNSKDHHVLVDPIRYLKQFNNVYDTEIKENIEKAIGKSLFCPAKKRYLDYNINVVKEEFAKIKWHWQKDLKPLIARILSEICGKQFTSYDGYDDELLRGGIINHEEAMDRARRRTFESKSFAESKKKELYEDLYSSYFHQLASKIESVILKILTRNGYAEETFSRKKFYGFCPKLEDKVRSLECHTEFDKLYTIWCFLKHNSISSYKDLKEKFPAVLKEEAFEYKKEVYEQGIMSMYKAIIEQFPEVLKIETWEQSAYAIYKDLESKCLELQNPEVPRSKVFEHGAMSMYKAMQAKFPEFQKEVCDQGEIETYTTLLAKYPDLQYEKREMERCNNLRSTGFHKEIFKQGEMALKFVELSDELIESILTGTERFLIEYCCLVFGENELEACWNSEEHFYSYAVGPVRWEAKDPMGLSELWDL